MDSLLSLKWNNHKSSFLHVLSTVRKKNKYADATLACDGKFYKVHKLVLTTCSEYFEQILEQTDDKHPVIVLKDIRSYELESLLSYMYIGEVNVEQEHLPNLIKAAECLKIKGLAVPDEEPSAPKSSSREKRSSDSSLGSLPKRRKEEVRPVHGNRNFDERTNEVDRRSTENKFRNESVDKYSSSGGNQLDNGTSNYTSNAQKSVVKKETPQSAQPPEINLEEPEEVVKAEPIDSDIDFIEDHVDDAKDLLVEDFVDNDDGQQHFMNQLLNHESQQSAGHYAEGGESSSSADPRMVHAAHAYLPRSQELKASRYLQATSAGRKLPALKSGSEDLFNSAQALDGSRGVQQQVEWNHAQQPASDIPLDADFVTPTDAIDFRQFSIGVGLYQCPLCMKVIKGGIYNVRVHYKTHTGEKPFSCPHCPYRATLKHNMKSHLLYKHAGLTGDSGTYIETGKQPKETGVGVGNAPKLGEDGHIEVLNHQQGVNNSTRPQLPGNNF